MHKYLKFSNSLTAMIITLIKFLTKNQRKVMLDSITFCLLIQPEINKTHITPKLGLAVIKIQVKLLVMTLIEVILLETLKVKSQVNPKMLKLLQMNFINECFNKWVMLNLKVFQARVKRVYLNLPILDQIILSPKMMRLGKSLKI